MRKEERTWFLDRLSDQIEKENDEMKKSSAKSKRKRGPKLPKGKKK